jgi:hypothetical protein
MQEPCMSTQSALALTGFIAWTLALLELMEVIRARLVLTKEVPANGFVPDNAKLSPFMQRPARAHANGLAGLPIVGGPMAAAGPARGRAEPAVEPACGREACRTPPRPQLTEGPPPEECPPCSSACPCCGRWSAATPACCGARCATLARRAG